jgi:hypothetical protein
MWWTWRFSTGTKWATSPDAARATTTEASIRKSTKPSSTQSAPPIAASASAGSPAGPDQRLALAVIAQAHGLQHRRAAQFGERRFQLGHRRDRAEGRRAGTPMPLRNSLLGEAVLGDGRSTRGEGWTGLSAARWRAVAAGTFSNSKVTTSTGGGEGGSGRRGRHRRRRWRRGHLAAGESASGTKTWAR